LTKELAKAGKPALGMSADYFLPPTPKTSRRTASTAARSCSGCPALTADDLYPRRRVRVKLVIDETRHGGSVRRHEYRTYHASPAANG
jgi:hypothetical protein